MPTSPPALELPATDPALSRWTLTVEPADVGCVLRGALCAMTTEALGQGIGAFLRAVSVYAAQTDAVLQTRVTRTAEPVVSRPEVVGELARLLSGAGVPVSFGRVWTPLSPGAACGLGLLGVEEMVAGLAPGVLTVVAP